MQICISVWGQKVKIDGKSTFFFYQKSISSRFNAEYFIGISLKIRENSDELKLSIIVDILKLRWILFADFDKFSTTSPFFTK